MDFQEALEYLNLPASCSRQLVRKRYLELKKDYLKAINNAPSDHFSALYRENLDKIEEAYNLLIETADIVQDPDNEIQNSIRETGDIIDSFLKKGTELTSNRREKIKRYIDEINRMQDQLRVENPGNKRANIMLPSERWELDADPEVKEKKRPGRSVETRRKASHTELAGKSKNRKNKNPRRWRWETSSMAKKPTPAPKVEPPVLQAQNLPESKDNSAMIEKWVIQLILQSTRSAHASSRRSLYSQVVSMAILLLLVLIVIGVIYLLYPLFFPAP